METLYYDLSKAHFSKSRILLIWIFAGIFFVGGMWILLSDLITSNPVLTPRLAIIPLAICLFITLVAILATLRGKNQYFIVDKDKIEYRNGMMNPKVHSFQWDNIAEVSLPHDSDYAILYLKDNTTFKINLMWIERKKELAIRKSIFYFSKEKNIPHHLKHK